jgi:integrase
LSELAARPTSDVATGRPDPLDPYIEGWLGLFSDHTEIAYRGDISQWREYVHELGGTMYGAEHVHFLAWCDKLRNGVPEGRTKPYAQTTRARKESAVTSFYDYCVEVGALRDEEGKPLPSPAHAKGAKHRTRPGAPAKPTPAMSRDQAEEFQVAASKMGRRGRLLCSILFTTGCRISELLNATVGDLHQEGGQVSIRVLRKGEKPDDLMLTADIGALLLKDAQGREATAPLIRGHKGGVMGNDEADWLVETAGTRAGVPFTVTPHVLRTTAINVLLEDKETRIHEVQQFAGHASITTTQIYVRRTTGRKQKATMAAKLGELVPDADEHEAS